MATIGRLDEFDPATDAVESYAERAQLFFEANDIAAGKQTAVFLSAIGTKTYQLLRDLMAPTLPKEKSFEDIVGVLKEHFQPKPLVIAERFYFHRSQQGVGESIADFVAGLRRRATHCEFGGYLDESLRDRFVCGVRSEATRASCGDSAKHGVGSAERAEVQSVQKLKNPTGAAGLQEQEVLQVTPGGGNNPGSCYRCGRTDHRSSQCPCRTLKCHNCGKLGHIKRVCRQKGRQGSAKHRVKTVQESDSGSSEDQFTLNQLRAAANLPLEVMLELEGRALCMEVDTGAARSIMSDKAYSKLFPGVPLQPTKTKLRMYSGESLQVLGEREVEVRYGKQVERLGLLVVKGGGPNLMGRDWLGRIRLNWNTIYQLQMSNLQDTLDRNQELFQPGLGTLKGFEAKIYVDPEAKPRFCKARPLPYAIRQMVEKELERLEKEGIIEPVQYADWAAPVVPVRKSDGKSLRLCGDFRVTVNQVSKLDKYPIPKIDDLFAKLAGGRSFTKLDMSQAYQQLILDSESRKYTVINTHRGLFCYNRLTFGIFSAPGIFQRTMESLLRGMERVVVYLDDVLVTGRTEEEHLATLDEVLRRMREAGLRLRRDKCVFLAPSVIYLGHRIDAQGLHPVADKLQAITEAPSPHNVSELKSYLGLLTYYAKFLPNLSTTLAPLYKLLKAEMRWKWGTKQERAFKESKKLFLASQLLVHFDPQREIRLACDASGYGIGAVLSHKMPDGSEKPIGFVSRTLTAAEKNYSQIEKEALACVYGVKRFHSYLFGHSFILQTDHEPLRTLFNHSKTLSPQTSARIQRWALTLASYEYTIACRKTEHHANADAMSRLPLPDTPPTTAVPPELVLMVEGLQEAPITAAQITHITKRDVLLAKVARCVLEGWPETPEDELRPFWMRRLELSVHDGCVVWGGRVVVPARYREHFLSELHGGHPGASRMKSLARGLVLWPGMDQQIKETVKRCEQCQQSRPMPAASPLQPWVWPTRPWTRLHIDFAGPKEGTMFLVIIDAHSKWMEVIPMKSATTLTTTQQLRMVFSRFGIPESIVSDNGPQFSSSEFEQFCRKNGIRHIRVSPYHPASNGLAERAVQTFKQGFQKHTEGTIQDRIARLLFHYRITPHSTTGTSPSQLLFGRQIRSRLDTVKPSLEKRVRSRISKQKEDHDRTAKERILVDGQKVYAKNFRGKPRWLPGTIIQVSGPLSFRVELLDGRVQGSR